MSALAECPRCRGWTLDPDDPMGHIVGTNPEHWQGGPMPLIVYCTPTGREARPLPTQPPLPPYRWTTNGYHRIGGRVVE